MSERPIWKSRGTRTVVLAVLVGLSLGLPIGAIVGNGVNRPRYEPVQPAERRETGTLILCGGVTAPSVHRRIVELAGGPNARIVVIPTASTFADHADEAILTQPFRDLGAGSVRVLHTLSRDVADDPAFSEPIRNANAVWMTGGSQSRLSSIYRGTRVERELHALFDRGGVVGGSSAGAAVMSDIMIAGGHDEKDLELGRGFNLLPDSVVDMHFLERGRIQRLLEALERHPGLYGLGIDAATALEYHDGTFRALGNSYVMTLFPGPGGYRFDVLLPDEQVTLSEMVEDARQSGLHILSTLAKTGSAETETATAGTDPDAPEPPIDEDDSSPTPVDAGPAPMSVR